MPHKEPEPRHQPPGPPADDPRKEESLKEREAEEHRQAILRPGPSDPGDDRSQGKETRGHDEVATRRHLEGSHQGPS